MPLPIRGEVTADDLRASMGWYPLIGAGLGLLGWTCCVGLQCLHLPAFVVAAITVILLEVCTGALHLDGVMDTCDGLGSGASRDRALAIMKDSRVGAMGVFGAVAVLLLKVAALSALLPTQSLTPLVIGWAAARATPIWGASLFPYARAQGTGAAFAAGRAPAALSMATVLALLIGYVLARRGGLLLAATVLVSVLLLQACIARKLGGLTGDVYGMGIEVGEVVALVAGVSMLANG